MLGQPAWRGRPDATPDPRECTRWAFVCESSSCRWGGSVEVREALHRALRDEAPPREAAVPAGVAPDRVAVVRTGCLGLCSAGPAVVTYPEGDVHLRVQPDDALDLAQHLTGTVERGRRQVKAPPWFRDQLVSRLGYYVDWLRRKASAQSG